MDGLTVIIPFWNGHATIKRLLDSLPADLPVVVVDDQSDVPYQSRRANVRVVRPEKKGYFAGAVNAGLAACNGDALILNQDSWLEGTAWLELLADKRRKYAFTGHGVFGHPAWPTGYVQGTFMLMRRDAISKIGGLNARDYPLWGCTAEWQVRACRAGFQALPVPEIPGFHHQERERGAYGSSITEALRREPDEKGRFIRTPPMISVVVPCFNYGRYLPDLVASLAGGPSSLGAMPGQTFAAWELVIVDDASSDNSAEIANSLADPWKGIRVVRRPRNGGTPAANNSGIKAAYGRYITILGADDMMEPWRLESLYLAAEAHPHSVIYDDGTLFKAGQRLESWRMPEYDFEALLEKNIMHAGILFPKRAWKETGGYPETMKEGREDWAFNIALGAAGYCGVRVAKAGYLYRRERHNRTLRNGGPSWREHFVNQVRELYPGLYQGERPMACCGGGRSPARKSNGHGGAVSLPGASGMLRIEYTGLNSGDMPWYGPATGTRYVFGGVRKTGYIDPKDARTGNKSKPGLLEMYEHGKAQFRAAPLPAPVPTPPPAPEAADLPSAPVLVPPDIDPAPAIGPADPEPQAAPVAVETAVEAAPVPAEPSSAPDPTAVLSWPVVFHWSAAAPTNLWSSS